MMTNVFIGGSRGIMKKLPGAVTKRIDNIIMRNFTALVGDASGADALIQKYLAEKGYLNTLVFCTGTCRRNAGGWKTVLTQANAGERGFKFYELKDRKMADLTNYGFMVWDGISKGTLNNVLNLLERNKSTLVYFAPEELFHIVRGGEDLLPLLTKCDRRATSLFEEKLGLSRRLSRLPIAFEPARITRRIS